MRRSYFFVIVATIAIGSSASAADPAAPAEQDPWQEIFENLQSNETSKWIAGRIGLQRVIHFSCGDPRIVPALLKDLENPAGKSDARYVMSDLVQVVSQRRNDAKQIAAAVLLQFPTYRQMDRESAIELLGQIGPDAKDAVDVLRPLLHDPSPFVRQRAARVMCRIDPEDSNALQVLIDDVRTKDAETRYRAIYWIGQIGSNAKAALPAIEASLKDDNSVVRAFGAIALWKIAKEQDKVLPLLRIGLSEEAVEIHMSGFIAPSQMLPSHHKYIIGCLGAMAKESAVAMRVLKDLTKVQLPLKEDNPIGLSFLWAYAHVTTNIPGTQAMILAAKDKDADIQNAARMQLGNPSEIELEKMVAQVEIWRRYGKSLNDVQVDSPFPRTK